MYRAFVYDPDVDPDRAKRAYMEFVPLDDTIQTKCSGSGQERPG